MVKQPLGFIETSSSIYQNKRQITPSISSSIPTPIFTLMSLLLHRFFTGGIISRRVFCNPYYFFPCQRSFVNLQYNNSFVTIKLHLLNPISNTGEVSLSSLSITLTANNACILTNKENRISSGKSLSRFTLISWNDFFMFSSQKKLCSKNLTFVSLLILTYSSTSFYHLKVPIMSHHGVLLNLLPLSFTPSANYNGSPRKLFGKTHQFMIVLYFCIFMSVLQLLRFTQIADLSELTTS